MKVIFLDIDGVLNRCNERWQFARDCIEQFNRVLAATEAKVCISSSWRKLMIDQDGARADMTTSGFATMLRTHGILGLNIIGHIGQDSDGETRGSLIRKWLKANTWERYVVLDDCDHGMTEESLFFVQTNPCVGLDVTTADDVIRILNRGQP